MQFPANDRNLTAMCSRRIYAAASVCLTPGLRWRLLLGGQRSLKSAEAAAGEPAATDGFAELGVHSFISSALKKAGITTPTDIQKLALPVTLTKGNHCVIHSETGTGKSLAFLVPSLQDPRPALTSLILAPTRELAVQLWHQAALLNCNKKAKKRIFLAVSGNADEASDIAEFLDARPHILIATPKRALSTFEAASQSFSYLQRVVVDEADKVLSPPRKWATKKEKMARELHPRAASILLGKVLALNSGHRLQLVAASATVDRGLRAELQELGWGPSLETLSTVSRATVPPLIKHLCVYCSRADKLETLVEQFTNSGEKSALAFIHRGAPITEFVHALNMRGLKAAALYNTLGNSAQYLQFTDDFRQGRIQIAVGTEETVRGLDFSWLDTVFILETPRSAAEYLHLCGRVGRAGRQGKAVVFVDSEQEHKRQRMLYARLGVTASETTA